MNKFPLSFGSRYQLLYQLLSPILSKLNCFNCAPDLNFPLNYIYTSDLIYFSLDDFCRSSMGLRRFSGVMTIFIIVMGVLGNALTIAALIKCPKIRNLTVAFITRSCTIFS